MDRRLLRRRQEVAEVRAHSSLSRLGYLLLLAIFAGLVIWLFRSPLLAVRAVAIDGALPSLTEEVRVGAGIALGQPLVTVRPGQVEANLLSNPRILLSEVELRWPDTVEIQITPRVPVAWIVAGGQWGLAGIDGVVLETAGLPGGGMPTLSVDPADRVTLLGGLEFAANLDPLLFAGATIGMQGEEIWAQVGGYEVRLGRAIDMAQKARTLNTILRQPLVPGSIINLIAPARPAIKLPASPEA